MTRLVSRLISGWLGVVCLALFPSRGIAAAPDVSAERVWPNAKSRANSDRWLVEHHDSIRELRPRVLVLNFSNRASREHLERLLGDLVRVLAEASRYHGYADPAAPACLKYEVFKFVDLRDDAPEAAQMNSSRAPRKAKPEGRNALGEEFNVPYAAFFSETFAGYYGVPDPARPGHYLDLAALVEGGHINELWFFAEQTPEYVPLEAVEIKPVYTQRFERDGARHVQAGNGGDPDMPWTGRSLRIGFINASRGIGCFLESLSHAIEGTAHSGAIPYFTRYFHEFAGFDLDRRYGLPWESFYPLWGEGKGIEYPTPTTAVIRDGAKTRTVTNYVAFGGNVHFSPNGRSHYDLGNTNPVMSTIEDWRMGSGVGGKDLARPWTVAAFEQYRETAPDCMGPWLVYWRQNFPGLENRQRDEDGRPMKNWWPFLFY